MKTAALYVVYNPDIEYLRKSIIAISKQVKQVIVVDNSDNGKNYSDLFTNIDNRICLLVQNGNVGIATALNVGCRKAIELGFDWVITLDQDSLPCDNLVDTFEDFINKRQEDKIGAVGPSYTLDHFTTNEICRVNTLITSGCLLNLSAFKLVGGFKDELFIDAVDTEYSWNLRKNGYKLYKFGNVTLEHHIGNNSYDIRILGKRLTTVTNHNFIRCYYITRNSLKISRDYKNIFPKEARFYRKKGIKLFINVLLFERDKKNKIVAICKGYRDFRKGVLGKYQ